MNIDVKRMCKCFKWVIIIWYLLSQIVICVSSPSLLAYYYPVPSYVKYTDGTALIDAS